MNRWYEPGVCEAAAVGLAEAGGTFAMLEWMPFKAGSPGCNGKYDGGCDTTTYPAEGAACVEALRSRGIIAFVNIANANAIGLGREGDGWINAQMDHLLAIGPDNVWLECVSEPWVGDTGKWEHWTRNICRARWSGAFILPDDGSNVATGRPIWGGIPFDWLVVHPPSIEVALRALRHSGPILVNTDHSGLLIPGPDDVELLSREALAHGKPLHFYGFTDGGQRPAALAAMAAAIGGRP